MVERQQLKLYVLVSVNSHLLKHVWKMLLDDAKRLPIHGKVVERLGFVLVYVAHVLQADVHFLSGNSSRFQHCQTATMTSGIHFSQHMAQDLTSTCKVMKYDLA